MTRFPKTTGGDVLVNCFGSTFHLRSVTRLIAPLAPNDVTGSPVRPSRQINRSRLLMKMRNVRTVPTLTSRRSGPEQSLALEYRYRFDNSAASSAATHDPRAAGDGGHLRRLC